MVNTKCKVCGHTDMHSGVTGCFYEKGTLKCLCLEGVLSYQERQSIKKAYNQGLLK